jgi:hypothetical protein
MDCGSLLPLSVASLLARGMGKVSPAAGYGTKAAAGCRSPWMKSSGMQTSSPK